MPTNQLGWVKLPHIAALDLAIRELRERQRWTRDDEREAAITSLEVVRKHFVNEVEWRSIVLAQRIAGVHIQSFLDTRGAPKPGHLTRSVQRPDSVEYYAVCECGWAQGDPVDRTGPVVTQR